MNERSTEVLNNYASRVFNDGAMRRYLPGDTYKQLKKIWRMYHRNSISLRRRFRKHRTV